MLFWQLELFLFKDDLSHNKYAILSIIKYKSKYQRKYTSSFPKLEAHVLSSDRSMYLFFFHSSEI